MVIIHVRSHKLNKITLNQHTLCFSFFIIVYQLTLRRNYVTESHTFIESFPSRDFFDPYPD